MSHIWVKTTNVGYALIKPITGVASVWVQNILLTFAHLPLNVKGVLTDTNVFYTSKTFLTSF